MSTTFDNLLSLTQSFEPSNGEKCNQFGNNVYQPIDGGIADFNKGVTTMSPYGTNYNLALNEAVEYQYDTQLLFDHLKPIEDLFTQKLKDLNKSELEHNKTLKRNTDYSSGIGFMQGVDGDVSEDEAEAIKMMKYTEHESKYPPMLSSNVHFDSKYNFLMELKNLFSDLPDEQVTKLISNASGFISEFKIDNYRDFINTIKTEIKNRNYSNTEREPKEFS
jgi:hypothetical protein